MVSGGFHPATGGDCPGHALRREVLEQLTSARQRLHAAGQGLVGLGVMNTQTFQALRRIVEAGFAQQYIREQSTAHANLSMDAPNRQCNAFRVERCFPGGHVLINVVNQRAIEIEQKGGPDAYHPMRTTIFLGRATHSMRIAGPIRTGPSMSRLRRKSADSRQSDRLACNEYLCTLLGKARGCHTLREKNCLAD